MWKTLPLLTTTVETLMRAGSCTDEELLRLLKKEDEDISPLQLNKVLLQLEVRGLIRVSNVSKGRRMIELTKRLE